MKKRLFCLLLLVALLLTGCATKAEAVLSDGTAVIIDRAASTITHGETVYRYGISGDTNKYTITITFPNGATYENAVSNGAGTDYWTGDAQVEGYLNGPALAESVVNQVPMSNDLMIIIAGSLMILLGLFLVLFPRQAWVISNRSLAKETEPSDEDLKNGRIMGAGMIVAGIAVFFL